MKLRLDFAHPRPSPALIGWLLLFAGLLAVAWAGWRYQSVSEGYQTEVARLAALTPKLARMSAGKAAPAKVESEFQATRNLLDADWGALLTALEKTRPANIAFLTLDVEAARGAILLSAEAKDQAAMLSYVEALERLPELGHVALASHADEERDGEKAVRFNLRAHWGTP